ncbi:MAG: GSCFA domain-containing protein, partial [Cyclobacteriaceae bacterium]
FFNKKRSLTLQQISLERKSKGCLNTFETASFLLCIVIPEKSMFRTELTPHPAHKPIKLGQKIVSIGSCFADCMGRRLLEYKFETLTNPFGVLFNPLSVASLLLAALRGNQLDPERIVERNGRYFHFDLHSCFHSKSPDELMEKGNKALAETAEKLKMADHLIITLGTAYAYRHLATDRHVANCHKMPQGIFAKELLSPRVIEEALSELVGELTRLPGNPSVTMTVSPVRHIKDTIPLNNVSKSTLRLVVHNLTTQHEAIRYFPSYELMMDDLRDYRFYKEDMLHPTPQAEGYIWKKFIETTFDDEAFSFTKEWKKMRNALSHRPLNPGSKEHKDFILKTISHQQGFSSKVNTLPEIEEMTRQLRLYE